MFFGSTMRSDGVALADGIALGPVIPEKSGNPSVGKAAWTPVPRARQPDAEKARNENAFKPLKANDSAK
jgi:hypothetical protein